VPADRRLSAQASITRQGLRIGSVQGQWRIDPAAEGSLDGELAAHLNDFPLPVLGALAEGKVDGTLSGSVRLKHRPKEVELRAMLNPRGIAIAGSRLGDGVLLLDGTRNQIHGQLQLTEGAAALEARILLGVAQEQHLQSFALQVNANRVEASLLAPALKGLVSRVGGQLDVQGQFTAERPAAGAEWQTRIDGLALWRGGSAYIDVLGLELRDVEGHAAARSLAGRNVISLSKLRAKARSVEHNLVGDANLTLSGLRVTEGAGTLALREFPFTFEGVPKGWGTGSARALLTRKPDHMLVEVDVESLTARLPSDTTREVLDIEDNPDFHVLQLRAANPEGPTLPWVFVIDLGYQTRVTKGNMNLRVAGQPRLSIGDEFTMSGELQLLHTDAQSQGCRQPHARRARGLAHAGRRDPIRRAARALEGIGSSAFGRANQRRR
jgi:hypothetical protein